MLETCDSLWYTQELSQLGYRSSCQLASQTGLDNRGWTALPGNSRNIHVKLADNKLTPHHAMLAAHSRIPPRGLSAGGPQGCTVFSAGRDNGRSDTSGSRLSYYYQLPQLRLRHLALTNGHPYGTFFGLRIRTVAQRSTEIMHVA